MRRKSTMVAILSGSFGRRTLGSGSFTVGRKADNQLVLDDRTVSSHHARIIPQGQGYSIIDLDSTNRTFINEQPLEVQKAYSLNSGDIIRVGDIRITYMVSSIHDPDVTIYAP